jgi:hypothetical protein
VIDTDARPLNWRFIVPDEPSGILLLGVGDERVDDAVVPPRRREDLDLALEKTRYPAIVCADLGGWAAVAGTGSRALLARLSASLEPGGWLYAVVENRAYPRRPARSGSMTLSSARAAFTAGGLEDVRPFIVLPEASSPAYVISLSDEHAFAHFLRHLFVPYVPGGSVQVRMERQVLAATSRVALRLPHRARTPLAPAFALLGRSAA